MTIDTMVSNLPKFIFRVSRVWRRHRFRTMNTTLITIGMKKHQVTYHDQLQIPCHRQCVCRKKTLCVSQSPVKKRCSLVDFDHESRDLFLDFNWSGEGCIAIFTKHSSSLEWVMSIVLAQQTETQRAWHVRKTPPVPSWRLILRWPYSPRVHHHSNESWQLFSLSNPTSTRMACTKNPSGAIVNNSFYDGRTIYFNNFEGHKCP